MGKTLTAPLERVRILRQATSRGSHSAVFLLRDIYTHQGISGLWRGNAVNLLRVVPSYAVRLTVFGNLSEYKGTVPLLGNPFVAGALSGLASSLASYPLEVLRTRISVTGTLLDAVRTGRFFAGCSMTVIETMPYAALSLGTYNYLTTHLANSDSAIPAVGQKILIGFVAGAVSTSVCFPIDTLRRNKIVRPTETISSIFQSLWTEGGAKRMYRGISIALTKSIPTVALTMTANDYLLDKFNVARH